MIEIKLDSTASFLNGHSQLDKKQVEAGKNDYKPYVMLIMSLESWKTSKQNRTMHALLSILWRSGCSSFESYEQMRNTYKNRIRLIDYYLYVDDDSKIIKVDNFKDIPDYIPNERKRKILGSFSNATKKQVREAIDLIITDCFSCGVNTSKVAKEFEVVMQELDKGKVGYRIK